MLGKTFKNYSIEIFSIEERDAEKSDCQQYFQWRI